MESLETHLECPLCGGLFKSIAHHLLPAHGLTADQYRAEVDEKAELTAAASRQTYGSIQSQRLRADEAYKQRLLAASKTPTALAKLSAATRRNYEEGRIAPTTTYAGKPKKDRSKCSFCDGPMPPEYATSYRNRETCSNECALAAQKAGHKRAMAQREFCKNGHQLTPDNTILKPTRHGTRTRRCRICLNAANRRWYQQRIEAQ